MNNFLKRNAPVLVFILVVALCGVWGWYYYVDAKGSDKVKGVNQKIKETDETLTRGDVPPEYNYSAQKAEEIKNIEVLKKNAERNKRNPPEEPFGTNVSYPQPVRPKSDAPPKPGEATDIFAEAKSLSNEKAHGDHGKVYVSADLPSASSMKLLEPVRIEVFRGVGAAKNIDLTKPYGIIELGLEDPPAPKTGPAVVAPPVAPAEQPRVRGTGDKKPPPPPFKLGDTRAFRDSNVEQQIEYFYQMRLVLRFTSTDNKVEETPAKPDGTKGEKIVHHAPKLKQKPDDKEGMVVATPLHPETKSKLYATDMTTPVSAKVPTNFVLRLAGVNGTVPPKDTPRNPAAHDRHEYSVNFEVRIWVNELKNWKVAQINELKEGEMLAGKIQYRVPGAAENSVYDFTKDLGYKLYEVNNEDVEIRGAKVVQEVATLENQRTKAMEKFTKERSTKTTENTGDELDKVIEAQEKEMERKKKEATAPAPAPTTPTK